MKKIAVLRANALGDFIFILPALQALRERFPRVEITLLGKKWHKEFLAGRPGPIDRVIEVPPYPGVGESEEFQADQSAVDAFFEEMQKENFDLAFQVHGGGRNSNPFLLRLGAKLTVGLKTPEAAELDISIPYVYYFSEILRYLEVVSKVGATTSAIEPAIQVTDRDLLELGELKRATASKKVAVIHPGASDPRRRWPGKNFAQVADFLVVKGYLVFITGTPSEQHSVNEVLSHCEQKNHIHNLCGGLSLNALTGLLSLTHVLVSNDTGPLHLARALKTPTVGIFWAGNSITGLSTTTAAHRIVPSFAYYCPLCGLSASRIDKNDPGKCTHNTSFVADVRFEDVRSAVQELLDLRTERMTSNNFRTISNVRLEREEIR